MGKTGRAILWGVPIAGTLDLLSAFLFGGMAGQSPLRVLQGVAAGPFGNAMFDRGAAGALAGACVHYAIMTAMVAAYVLAARRRPPLVRHPVSWGALYGFGLYLVMYWIVLPLRWPDLFPKTAPWPVANALFSHLVCVGIPIGLVTARFLGRRSWARR